MDKNRPPNIFDMPNYDLGQKQQVAIPIFADFTQAEAESNIDAFAEADAQYREILKKVPADYPFPVHCMALPQVCTSAWLQGVSVQRLSDQLGIKPAKTQVCLELSRTKDPLSGLIYISFESLIYLAARESEAGYSEQDFVVIIDKILEHYAKKV